MKKILFLTSALIMSTMMWATVETYTFKSFTSSDEVVLSANNFTITLTKGTNNKPAFASEQARIYPGGTMVISSTNNITKIEYNYTINANKKGKVPTVDGAEGSKAAGTWAEAAKTWTGSDTEVIFSISGEAGNVGFTSVTVTTNGEGGGEGEDGEGGDEGQDGETITVAKALEIGDALAKGGKTTTEYLVKGYVVTAYDFDTEHKNQSFYLSDDKDAERGDFFAKYTTGDIVKEGDLVIVSGNIEKYEKNGKTTIQIFRGVAKVISEGEDGDGGEGDGGEGQGGGQGDADVTITGLQYAGAYYSEGYWEFDLYNDFDYDNGDYIYPEVYFSADEEAKSKTSIVGTYSAYYAGYWKSAKDSVETDEYEPIGTLTVTCVGEYLYNFVGSFVGQDGKTYKWNATDVLVVWVIDYDNDEEIELTDMPMAVENTEANVQSAIKTLRNGQVLIHKNNKVYTVLGQEVK